MQTLYLESQHEITDVIELIRRAKSDVIALTAGDRLGMLQSSVNFKLLSKAAKTVDKTLILVSSDSVSRALATDAGWDTYPSMAAAERALRGEAEPELPEVPRAPALEDEADTPPEDDLPPAGFGFSRRPIGEKPTAAPVLPGDKLGDRLGMLAASTSKPMLIFLGAALLTIGLGIWFVSAKVLPSAEILLVPQTQTYAEEFTVVARESVDKANLVSLEVPAYYYEASDQANGSARATGQDVIGTKAEGSITLYNRGYSRPVSLAAGTAVTSYDGQVFRLVNDTVIPGIVVDAGQVTTGRKNAVAVIAEEVGEEYNIDRTDFTIADLDSNNVWGESAEAFKGGEKRDAVVVSEEDVEALRTQLLGDLLQSTEQQIRTNLPDDQTFVKNALVSRISEETLSHQVGEETENFELTIRVRAQGLAVRPRDIQTVSDRELGLAIPQGYELIDSGQTSLEQTVQSIDFNGRQVTLTIRGSGVAAKKLDDAALRRSLAGLTPSEAEQVLRLYDKDLIDYRIRLSPGYVNRIPELEDKINLRKLTVEDFRQALGSEANPS